MMIIKKSYAKKITTRLTQEDVDYINQFKAEHEVYSIRKATRMLLEMAQVNLEELQKRCDIRIIKGEKAAYIIKLSLWVSNETNIFIEKIAEIHDVPLQEASRFLIRLTECNTDILKERTNFFIVR